MTVDVSVDTVIARSVDDVSAYAGDPSNAPRWYQRIRSAVWQTDPPLRVGSQIAFEARFLGRTLAYTYEVTELVPGKRLVMQTADGPFPMSTTYEFSDVGDGATRMTLRNHGEPSGFSRLTAPVMSRAMRGAMSGDLALLKEILESGRR